jgi:hypothetical protein
LNIYLTPTKCGWYEGLVEGIPSQDNALEATNKWIKEDGTLRDQLPLSEFLDVVENKIIVPWSKSRNVEDFLTTKEFQFFPPIDSALWKIAYNYHQEKRRVIKVKFEPIEYQCVGCTNVTVARALTKQTLLQQLPPLLQQLPPLL